MDTVKPCCECNLEASYVRLGGNLGSQVVGLQENGTVRGEPAGDFNTSRPAYCFVHHDWCSRRPTLVTAEISPTIQRDGFGDVTAPICPHGTARVFIEADADLQNYVYAETEMVANVPFPQLQSRNHYYDDVIRLGGPYEAQDLIVGQRFPVFGTNSGTKFFVPRNAQDEADYTMSAWPLARPSFWSGAVNGLSSAGNYSQYLYTRNGSYVGTERVIRCGYRADGADVVVQELVSPYNAMVPMEPGASAPQDSINSNVRTGVLAGWSAVNLAVGCSWLDIVEPRDDGMVSCGVQAVPELQANVQNHVAGWGLFSLPFEVPRSFLVEESGGPHQHRYVGVSADSQPTISAIGVANQVSPAPDAVFDGQTTTISVRGVRPAVSCGANQANVWINPSDQEEATTTPATSVGVASGTVSASSPFFVRRPDAIERARYTVPSGDAWHAAHLVRYGSPLSGRNALHGLRVELVEATLPPISPPVQDGPVPARIQWLGSNMLTMSLFGGNIWSFDTSSPGEGTRFWLQFLTDFTSSSLPPLWAWNAMSGQHVLGPLSVDGRRLLPNCYLTPSVHLARSIHYQIVDPQPGEVGLSDSIGPFTPQQFAEYEAIACPESFDDRRVEWSLSSYPQLWARTRAGGEFLQAGPLNVVFEDSGMNTRDYDRWVSNPAERWYPASSDMGVVLQMQARLGLKINVSRVKGYRRARELDPSPLAGGNRYRPVDELVVCEDVECNDVAFTEFVFDWDIPLTAQEVQALSDGAVVEKTQQPDFFFGFLGYRTTRLSIERLP